MSVKLLVLVLMVAVDKRRWLLLLGALWNLEAVACSTGSSGALVGISDCVVGRFTRGIPPHLPLVNSVGTFTMRSTRCTTTHIPQHALVGAVPISNRGTLGLLSHVRPKILATLISRLLTWHGICRWSMVLRRVAIVAKRRKGGV